MMHSKQPSLPSRLIRVPLRLIECAYGRGNFDDAGDDIIYALRQVSTRPDQFRFRFEFDSSHPNPWYHSMIVEVEGMPDTVHARFAELLAGLGLAESCD